MLSPPQRASLLDVIAYLRREFDRGHLSVIQYERTVLRLRALLDDDRRAQGPPPPRIRTGRRLLDLDLTGEPEGGGGTLRHVGPHR